MGSRPQQHQDRDSTLYIGNLAEQTTDSLIWELMLQAGPIINVHLPKDRVTQTHQGYGFVEFASEEDAEYAAKIMNQVRLWGKPVRVNKASADKRGGPGQEGQGGSQGVGAELFVGNLDGMVDEKVLFETFSRFGPLVAPPKVARDEANLSKGYGFISYSSFEASDDAIANMHGQYLMNKEITVQYAYKKDGKGERHGDEAERQLARNAKLHGVEVMIPAMPASLVMPNNVPSAPNGMGNGYPNGAPPVRAPQPPPAYNYGGYPPQGGYANMPPPSPVGQQPNGRTPLPPQQFPGAPQGGPPNRGYPLQPPPGGAGLPARPPPSAAGYGGPQVVPSMGMPPGAPPGFAQGMPPPGFQPPGPPAGFRPPSGVPNGFAPPPQR